MCLLNFVLGNSVTYLKQTALSGTCPVPVAPSLRPSQNLGLCTQHPHGSRCRHSLEQGGSRQHGLPPSCSGRTVICQGQVRWQMVAEGGGSLQGNEVAHYQAIFVGGQEPSPSPTHAAQGGEVWAWSCLFREGSALPACRRSFGAPGRGQDSQICCLEIGVLQRQVLGSSTRTGRFSRSEGPHSLPFQTSSRVLLTHWRPWLDLGSTSRELCWAPMGLPLHALHPVQSPGLPPTR